MIGSIGRRYLSATRYVLLEQAKNRMAIILLIAFVPIWYYLVSLFATQYMPVDFKFRVTGDILHVSSYNL
jgi:ABC-2 type transport system permease protein